MSLLALKGATVAVQIAADFDVLEDPEETDWAALPQPDAIWWTTAPVTTDNETPTAAAAARFRDAARALDPEHTSGLEPWTHARLVVTYDSVDHVVARGYILEWPVAEQQFKNQVSLDIHPATAAMNRPVPNPFGWEAQQAGAAGVWLLDDPGDTFAGIDGERVGEWSTTPAVASTPLLQVEAGYVVFDGSVSGKIRTSEFAPPTALPIAVEVCASLTPDSTTSVDKTYSLVEANDGTNSTVIVADYDVSEDTITLTAWTSLKSASNGIVTAAMPAADWAAGRAIVYRVTDAVEELWLDGTLLETSTVAAPSKPASRGTFIGGGAGGGNDSGRLNWVGGVANLAIYKIEVGSSLIERHWDTLTGFPGDRVGERLNRLLDVYGWPPGRRDIDTGIVACGPWDHTGRTLIAELRILERTEQGRLFIAGSGAVTLQDRHHYTATTEGAVVQTTFSDVVADILAGDAVGYTQLDRATQWADIVNDVTAVSRPLGAQRRYVDTTSRDRRGHQPPNGARLETVARRDELLSLAATRVQERKDPTLRVPTIRWSALHVDSTVRIPIALARTVGDRVHLQRQPQGVGTPISLDLESVAVAHTLTVDSWDVDVHVTRARTATGWWSPGTSKVGVDSVWAP